MSIYWDKGKSCWRFTFNRLVEGKRTRVTKLLPKAWSQRRAEEYDEAEKARLYDIATGKKTARLNLAGAIKLYVDEHLPTVPRSRKAATEALAYLAEVCDGAWLDEVPKVAAKYAKAHAELLDDGSENPDKLAPGTVRMRLAFLRAAVRWAYKSRHHYGDRDYSDRMVLPQADNERHFYLDLAGLQKLWDAFEDEEARAMFMLEFYCGLRWRAELFTRTAEHVVTKADGSVWLEIGKTKNGERVMKPVNVAARPYLRFIPWGHCVAWYYERWVKAVAVIGRPEMVPHDLRHCLATEVLGRHGGNLDHVRVALHHKSLAAAQRYAHITPKLMQSVLEATGRENAHQPKIEAPVVEGEFEVVA